MSIISKIPVKVMFPLVAIVWGIVIYKIIAISNPTTPPITVKEFNNNFNPNLKVKVDTFSIHELDRDPFLGTLSGVKQGIKSNYKKRAIVKGHMPKIKYSGSIKKQNDSHSVFVITINGKEYLLKKGDVADSVKLITGNVKSIKVKYKHQIKTISK